MKALTEAVALIASRPKQGEPEYEGSEFRQNWEDDFGKYAIEALHDDIDQARAALPDLDRLAALLAFVEQMARMTTPEDEFAAEGEEGDELRARYDDADDYRADLDDDRLCGEFDAFMTMIEQARDLLKDSI